jgi:tetratricopeptide (TPR) repeat protein
VFDLSIFGAGRAERRAVLLETDPDRSLLGAVSRLVDPVTGNYAFPALKSFDDYKKIQAEGIRGEGQVVAIVDTGVDDTHPLLRDAIVEARDFTDEGTPRDLHGHGTLVALIIHYCAPRAKLINAKAFGKSGSTKESTLADALDWVGDRRPTVVNLSAGISARDPAAPWMRLLPFYFANKQRDHWLVSWLRGHGATACRVCAAADWLTAAGTSVCVAVGNERGRVSCPGRTRNGILIVVGAATVTAATPSIPRYSASWPDLVAPELPIAEGTSFSTPFVSGLCALLSEAYRKKNAGSGMPANVEAELRRADELFNRGEFAEAVRGYTSALASDPHLAEHEGGKVPVGGCVICQALIYPARAKLGLAYLHTGQAHDAVLPFKQNVDAAPEFPDAYMNWGAALRETGQLKEAVAAYEHASRLDPVRGGAYDGLGESYFASGSDFYDRAIEAFEQSMSINPNQSYAISRLADTCEAKGDADRAAALRGGEFPIAVDHFDQARRSQAEGVRVEQAGLAAETFARLGLFIMAARALVFRASALCGRARVLRGTQWTVDTRDAAEANHNATDAFTVLAQSNTHIGLAIQGSALSWSARALTLLAEIDHGANEAAIDRASRAVDILSALKPTAAVTVDLAHAHLHLARAFYFRKQCYCQDRSGDAAQIEMNASEALRLSAGNDAYTKSEGEWLIANAA